jgi:hypothetical protein
MLGPGFFPGSGPVTMEPDSTVPRTGGEGEPNGTRAPQSVPLSAVVQDAVRRWFLDTHKEALRGDVVSSTVQPSLWPA